MHGLCDGNGLRVLDHDGGEKSLAREAQFECDLDGFESAFEVGTDDRRLGAMLAQPPLRPRAESEAQHRTGDGRHAVSFATAGPLPSWTAQNGMSSAKLFGRDAATWAANAGTVPAIFAGLDGAVDALVEIVRQRMNAAAPVAAIDVPEPELVRAIALVEQGIKSVGAESRTTFLDLLAAGTLTVNGRPQHELQVVAPQLVTALRDVALLAEYVLVRSQTQATRLRRILGHPLPRLAVDPARDARVPGNVRVTSPRRLVVWAPDAPAGMCMLLALALNDLGVPLAIVSDCAQAIAAEFGFERVPVAHASAALHEAVVVVDASAYDPGAALALADVGVPLATAATSGAHEYLVESATFVPWSRISIRSAAITALGHGPALRTVFFPSPYAKTEPPTSGELVSIIVPTFNRRDDLVQALASIEAQTYRTIEAIVVNDAGEPVDDVVERFPCARRITNATNLRLAATRNVGIEASRGRYIAFLDDDDLLFPDHVAHLVAALERTGAAFAYGNVLSRFFLADPAGARLRGYWIESARSVGRSELLVANAIPVIGAMIRRETLAELGGFDAGMNVCLEDYELWLRLVADRAMIHVDRVTSIYNKGEARTNMIHRNRELHGAEIQRVWARHPVAEGSSIAVNRRSLLEQLEREGGPPVSQPPIVLDAPLESYAPAQAAREIPT